MRNWKMFAGCCLLALATAASANAQVVISQVYGGGGNSGSTYRQDYIELFNRGNAPVDITGWSVQYASATGSGDFQVTPINGTINPGQYFLVGQAQGNGGTIDIPTPDATGTIAMSGTAGKVALVNMAMSIGAPTNCNHASVVDFVGYGNANCFEGAGPAPALTNPTANFRADHGCTDTNNNNADFSPADAMPRNSASPLDPCAGPDEGACCAANGDCTIVTESACLASGGVFQGNGTTCTAGVCPGPTGACCLAEGVCEETTNFSCTAIGGDFSGVGTSCTPNNCPQPTGACCLPGGTCDVIELDECVAGGGNYIGTGTTCNGTLCPEPVQPGDIALGLSNGNRLRTAEQIRGGTLIGHWNAVAFLQSMEFDNAFGQTHNADGNLLAANFGATPMGETGGGELYNLSTDGSDRAQLLYRWNTTAGGTANTRIGGLSASPDNAYIAAIGYDSAEIYVLEYDQGADVGEGQGAAVSNVLSASTTGLGLSTQGTAWLDNDTAIAAIAGFAGDMRIITVDVVGAALVVTDVAGAPLRGAASLFFDIEYNPEISPYVYAQQSSLTESVSTTTVQIFDPNGWALVKTVILDTSMQTGREIALGGDNNLYLAQFAGATPRIYVDRLDLDLDNDGDIDLLDTSGLTDNTSTDYYSQTPGVSASFIGMDVAIGSGTGDVCGDLIRGDSNDDGIVNNFDIDPFVAALTNANCTADDTCRCLNDVNCDGIVNNFDIDPFVACLTGGCPPCP